MPENSPIHEPLLLTTDQAARLLGIGRTSLYSMHTTDRLGPMPVRLGRRILWRHEELKRWVDAGCPPRRQWVKNKQNLTYSGHN